MITRFHVENYKALRDVTLDLTPLHVLIGKNDTGKSSILEALGALCRSVEMPLSEAFDGRWDAAELVTRGSAEPVVTLSVEIRQTESQTAPQPTTYRLQVRFGPQARQAQNVAEELGPPLHQLPRGPEHLTNVCHVVRFGAAAQNDEVSHAQRALHASLQGVRRYRWDPSMLALPNPPQSSPRSGILYTGFGLAAALVDECTSPEALRDPKADCLSLLAGAAREVALREAYGHVSKTCNLDVLARRCPKGFGKFADRVRALAK